MHNPKVSIIVPVHNSGKYFENCLYSLVNQTLKEIELILVIDCPTDGSELVAEKFAQKDNRIKLIYNKTNLHIGLSRNEGIKHARGKYIGFCDHDDYCEPAMFEMLYDKIESENLDIVRCNYINQTMDKKILFSYPLFDLRENLKEKSYVGVIQHRLTGAIWNHLFNADFIRRNNISFVDTKITKSEDRLFFIETYYFADKIGHISNHLYCHFFHENNTGSSLAYTSLSNTTSFLECIYIFLLKNNLEEKYKLAFAEGIARNLYSSYYRQFLQVGSLKEIIKRMKETKKNKILMSNLNNLYHIRNVKTLFNLKITIILFLITLKLV